MKKIMISLSVLMLAAFITINAQAQSQDDDLFVVTEVAGEEGQANAVVVDEKEQQESSFIKDVLKDIEFLSQIRFEFDDNVFSTENDEQSDVRPVFTQAFKQNVSKDKHYFEWFYQMEYQYLINEDVDVVNQNADLMYSYRPNDQFSWAVGYHYDWLKDSSITSTIGDRLLALGYQDHSPFVQAKYEINPRTNVETQFDYRLLDVRNGDDDDFIDHESYHSRSKLSYDLTDDNELFGFVGYEYTDVDFKQINEKSATTNRPFIGILKKFPNFMNVTTEVGFVNVDVENIGSDDSVDFSIDLESTYSLFTKLNVGYRFDQKNVSLRREYAQYDSSQIYASLKHLMTPKSTIHLDYTYEVQDFDASNALIGQSQMDSEIDSHIAGIGVEHRLNSFLTLEGDYVYTQRNASFTSEDYTDNKFIIGLTARY